MPIPMNTENHVSTPTSGKPNYRGPISDIVTEPASSDMGPKNRTALPRIPSDKPPFGAMLAPKGE